MLQKYYQREYGDRLGVGVRESSDLRWLQHSSWMEGVIFWGGRGCRGGVAVGMWGTEWFGREAAKPEHLHSVFVHPSVRAIILTPV